MQLTKQQQKMQELQNTVIAKCWEDDSFKANFLANPISAIKDLTGETLRTPDGKKLVVVDQTDNSMIYFNIPAMPDLDNLELTDEQLELVAGGIAPLIVFTYFAAAATVGGLIGDAFGND